MAGIITNTFLTFSAKGLREQLANAIYNITPWITPFVSRAAKVNAKGTLEEWQTESLAAVSTTNAQLQGDDVTTYDAVSATVRVGNYTQISRKTVIIADTEEVVDKAGRKSEIAHQIARKGKELKRDIEAIVLASHQGGLAGNSTTAPLTACLDAWLKANTNFYTTDGADPVYTSGVPAAARTDGGTLRAFTETIAKDVLQQCYVAGAEPTIIMVGPFNKGVVSGFAGNADRVYNLNSAKPGAIIGSADVYVSEWGVLDVMPNRFQRERDAWFLDFDYVQIMHLRPFKTVELAKTGDAEKRMLIQEWGLKVLNESALGAAYDLTTA